MHLGDNVDWQTVEGFGQEWAAYDQEELPAGDFAAMFDAYFHIFPFDSLPDNAVGFDLGCGSGRWAAGVVDRVGLLHCIDPAAPALDVARRRLAGHSNVRFHLASSDSIPLADGSADFGYSLGVLHHVPDTAQALRDCVSKLKPGAPFLVYLYYRFDTRPLWFRATWRASDTARKVIFRLPFAARKVVTSVIAATVYWPLARGAALAENLSVDVSNFPLSLYRKLSFYTMRTDALDRFGTRLEQRFTRPEIESMMRQAGLADIRFSNREPFWVACGIRTE
jgi:SAM-dependent methyltransferase